MSDYSKYNLVYRLQKWMDTVAGQTFLNYAYSWGASVVILGALFKLTHLPGANLMLFLGMGTEVFVFFISAFDRPFDKTADGREIPTRLTEEFLATGKVSYGAEDEGAEEQGEGAPVVAPAQGGAVSGGNGGTTVIFAGGVGPAQAQPAAATEQPAATGQGAEPVQPTATVQPAAPVQPTFVPQMSPEDAEKLNEAQAHYVDELNELVETLKKVNEQSERLTRDSEEMENLNRTLTGISKVYEMQLKGASQQIGTIDQINDQSRRMAQQIEQLNQIYARMIEAMTVNMPAAARAAAPTQPTQPTQPAQ